ncbi:MAG: hypothetical protein Q8O49_00980 [bacterium]|nr:hypothetical protein [bacterium]
MIYKAIGFDYGGVIAGPTGGELREAICALFNITKEEFREVYFRHNTVMNDGDMTYTELWTIFAKEIGQPEKTEDLLKLIAEWPIHRINEDVLELAEKLKNAGYKIGMLSNNFLADLSSVFKIIRQKLAEKTNKFFGSIFSSAQKALALRYQEDFDQNYFVPGRKVTPTGREFTPANFPAAYQDNGLEAGTVYLYRLELKDANNPQQRLAGTNVIYGAGQTLPDGAAIPQDVRVCTRNNFCGTVQGERVGNNWPENQCAVNADCRNVGSFYTIIREN